MGVAHAWVSLLTLPPGFLALEFEIGSEKHYSWLAIEHSSQEPLVFGRLTGWAYESTPGESIRAGAIPEPSTSLLLLISVGIGLFKRSREY